MASVPFSALRKLDIPRGAGPSKDLGKPRTHSLSVSGGEARFLGTAATDAPRRPMILAIDTAQGETNCSASHGPKSIRIALGFWQTKTNRSGSCHSPAGRHKSRHSCRAIWTARCAAESRHGNRYDEQGPQRPYGEQG